jgi:hypothetical protein
MSLRSSSGPDHCLRNVGGGERRDSAWHAVIDDRVTVKASLEACLAAVQKS